MMGRIGVLALLSVATSGLPACREAATVSGDCWRLLPPNRVRVLPAPGQAAAMTGGKIQGSNDSPTNGFVDLATITSAPRDHPAYTELALPNATPYRYLRYWGPPGSYGQVAEIELYSGATRLTGSGFGTAGSRSGNPWPNALDGDGATFFDGPLANDVYVGFDAASEHLVDAPSFSPPGGDYPSPVTVTVNSATPGAVIHYTTDGSDPAVGGIRYAGPVRLSGTVLLRAVASGSCRIASDASAAYQTGAGSTEQASIHVGNSLTDTIEPYLQPLAVSGGIALDWWRYTIPGIGTYIYADEPTGGNGLESAPTQNIQEYLRTKAFDHVSFQPAANMPCVPTGHAGESPASNRSDAVNIVEAWDDAVGPDPSVQMWVYATWPAPADFANCMSGDWNRDPAIWNPPAATSWEQGVDLMLQYDEAVRAGLVSLRPARPQPFIVPAGLALKNLKVQVEAGAVPGMATGSFFTRIYEQGLATDDHLTSDGRYLVSLVFYAVMFQQSPVGLPHADTTLTDAQAAVFQQVAWDTVQGYPLSGVGR
jgi:hypothetical protein